MLQAADICSSLGEIIWLYNGTFEFHYLGFTVSKFTKGANLLSHPKHVKINEFFVKHNHTNRQR